jgi:MFS family permease
VVSLRTLVGDDADVLADRNFQLLLLASISSPLGASVVSPILTELTGPFGVSATRAGLLMSAFTAPAIVFIPLVGVLSDRYGRKPVLTAGLALFGAAGLAVPAAAAVPPGVPLLTEFRAALGLRLLQGVGYTGIAPVLITATGDIFDGDAEATAQGLRFTTVGISLTVFPLVSGLLVAVAWSFPFLLYAVALPSAVAVWLVFTEPTGDSSDESTADSASDSGDDSAADSTSDTEDGRDASPDGGTESKTERGDVRALLRRVREPAVAATLLGRAVPGFVWFAFLTYNSVIVVGTLGGSPGEAGALVAVASVASAATTTQLGRVTSRFGARFPALAGLVTTCLGLALVALAPAVPVGFAVGPLALTPGVPAALFGGTLVGGGFSVTLTLYRTAITGLGGETLRGGLVSLGESVGRVGSTSSPILTAAAVAALRPGGTAVGGAVRSVLLVTAVGSVAVGAVLLAVGEMETSDTGDG